jgi:hypothetical protein
MMFLPYQEYKETLPVIISDFLENQISLIDLKQRFNSLFLETIPTECFSINEFHFYAGLDKLLMSPEFSEQEVYSMFENFPKFPA